MGQYEGRLSDTTSFRLGTFGYATTFRSAGVLREADVANGTVSFFDSYDSRQGGDALRAQVHFDLHGHSGDFSHDQTVFLLYRSTRILENHRLPLGPATPPNRTLTPSAATCSTATPAPSPSGREAPRAGARESSSGSRNSRWATSGASTPFGESRHASSREAARRTRADSTSTRS